MQRSILIRGFGSARPFLHALAAATIGLTACTPLRPLGESTASGSDSAARDGSFDGCTSAQGCSCFPTITSVDLRTVAHGANVVLSGSCLTGATFVRIAGVDQTFAVDSDTRISVTSVADSTPIGAGQSLVVGSASASSGGFVLPVVHLVISELDTRTSAGAQRNQFVEVTTGVSAALDLSDYTLVIVDGLDDGVHDSPVGSLLGTTTTLGRYVLGGSKASNTQARIANDAFTTSTNAAAVVLLQSATLPPTTGTLAELQPMMIDALVYAGSALADDTGLLSGCYANPADRVQANEDASGMALAQSIRRCGDARRSGLVFAAAAPTPGAANGCP